MNTVAIIMTAYNGEKYIGEQIDSILASSYQDFEVFIYDDGSKDRTMSILQTYIKQNPSKIHVFQNQINLGVTVNFLKALSGTTMDYVMFCDQDDVWKQNKIALTLKRMRHMEAQISKATPLAVFTDANIVDQNLKIINNSFFGSNHLNPKKTDLPHILMENKLIGCTVMINAALRKVLQSNRLPEKAKFHDWWIALIAASFGSIGYVNERTLLYRQHESNVVGGADFFTYVKNRVAALKDQKESVHILIRQAEEFLELYGEQLPQEKREMIRKFVEMNHLNFINKRMMLVHYGYLKTGFIRNVGLLIIV